MGEPGISIDRPWQLASIVRVNFHLVFSHVRSTIGLVVLLVFAFTARPIRAEAEVIAGAGEAGLREALAKVADGGTVLLTSNVMLEATVRLDRDVTLRYAGPRPFDTWIYGTFAGPLFQVAASDVTLEGLDLWGSPQTDGFAREGDGRLTLRDCVVADCRSPVTGSSWWDSRLVLRLERSVISGNHRPLVTHELEARDSIFSANRGGGAGAYMASIVRCQFDSNHGDGLQVTFGTVRDCVFRFNADFGLRFDPDPGVLNLSGCLFYANSGGALLLREEAIATVDHCTFTRHTGPPAVVVSEANRVLFRHCTITDNLVLGGGQPGLWPSYPRGAALALMSGQVELQNCLVADNPTDDSPHASGLAGEWTDGGGNLIGGPARLAIVSDDSSLAPFYLVPMPGSAAIDIGRLSDLVRDARGLSRQAGAAPDAGAVEAGAGALADTDADGIPDIWENFRLLDPTDPGDAGSDTDGDGSDARSEYLASTDPGDAESVQRLRVVGTLPDPLGAGQLYLQLQWPNVPGVAYRIEMSADLRTWTEAPGFYWPNWEFQTPVQAAMTFYRLVGLR